MEHGYDGEDGVRLRQANAPTDGDTKGVQDRGAVTVDDALRFASGAGGIAHRRRVPLVQVRPWIGGFAVGDQLLVGGERRGLAVRGGAIRPGPEVLDALEALCNTL